MMCDMARNRECSADTWCRNPVEKLEPEYLILVAEDNLPLGHHKTSIVDWVELSILEGV
jgi:hypothetical protein